METTVNTLKALADRNRLRITMALQQNDELCACQITEFLQVSGATVSRHLGVLQRAGILQSRKDGKWIYYRLCTEQIPHHLLGWLIPELKSSPDIQADQRALSHILSCTPEEICRKQRGEACCPLPDTETKRDE
jgi:ArsR family transcriptional regulator